MLSIVPPDQARATAAAIAAAAGRTGARPLVSDWNAVAPATAGRSSGCSRRPGSSSSTARSPAARRAPTTGRASTCPARAPRRSRSGAPAWIDAHVVGEEIGLASAVKMCTASMYKGSTALLAHALLTAHAHGVLPQVLDDLHDSFPAQIDRAARSIAVSTTKAGRFVGEMREIAATQAAAGLTSALFEAMAEVYAALARSELAGASPKTSRARRISTMCSSVSGSQLDRPSLGAKRPFRGFARQESAFADS